MNSSLIGIGITSKYKTLTYIEPKLLRFKNKDNDVYAKACKLIRCIKCKRLLYYEYAVSIARSKTVYVCIACYPFKNELIDAIRQGIKKRKRLKYIKALLIAYDQLNQLTKTNN